MLFAALPGVYFALRVAARGQSDGRGTRGTPNHQLPVRSGRGRIRGLDTTTTPRRTSDSGLLLTAQNAWEKEREGRKETNKERKEKNRKMEERKEGWHGDEKEKGREERKEKVTEERKKKGEIRRKERKEEKENGKEKGKEGKVKQGS